MIIKTPFFSFDIQVSKVFRSDNQAKQRKYNKVFCIGSAKTGTTSLEKLLRQFGFKLGSQQVGEVLSRDWLNDRNSDRIVKFCHTADAFQDAPFGYEDLYKVLDNHFPNSKFILSVRNNSKEWFDSQVRFHTKRFSSDLNRPPTIQDLKNATHLYKGFMYETYYKIYGQYGIDLYNEAIYKKMYEDLNQVKRDYFLNRPNSFIEINLTKKEDFQRLCDFLEVKTKLEDFPHMNKSQ